jgi:hypothetical protein
LALLILAGGVLAQTTASHRVSVSIPVVLRLRLDGDRSIAEGAVDVEVVARSGVTTIDPGTTRIEVRANASWTLDARFLADPGSEAVALTARLEGSPWQDLRGGVELLVGDATQGWTVFEVAYGVAHLLSDGVYRGTVLFTLTRP